GIERIDDVAQRGQNRNSSSKLNASVSILVEVDDDPLAQRRASADYQDKTKAQKQTNGFEVSYTHDVPLSFQMCCVGDAARRGRRRRIRPAAKPNSANDAGAG